MDKETLFKYSPVIVVIVSILFQWNMFVTPEKLEVKHREILKDISTTYVPKEQYNMQYLELKQQMADMQKKIDKIYDILSKK